MWYFFHRDPLGVIFQGMDLWGLYNRYQPGDANGFRSDEEENQGQAADAWRSKVQGERWQKGGCSFDFMAFWYI